jgi:hypothetical protein
MSKADTLPENALLCVGIPCTDCGTSGYVIQEKPGCFYKLVCPSCHGAGVQPMWTTFGAVRKALKAKPAKET